jgi:hypothetical protein
LIFVAALSTLIVSRTSEQDAKQRQVYVSLDGEQIAYLMFGETKTLSIAAGKHTLKANNTLVWKTVDFEAQPGEQVRFTLVNYTGRGFALLLALFGVSLLFLKVERT